MKLKSALPFLIGILLMACKKEEVKVGEIVEIKQEPQQQQQQQAPVEPGMAPSFAFQSIDGQQVSLADLKGKFVYVDIWATWCRPCLMQIPTLKEVEEMYKGKDIHFVSVSVDNEKQKAKWEKMVKEQNLGGLQLYAGSDIKFQSDYKINSIPRFLLIGRNGELISGDAPRPLNHQTGSVNSELTDLFDSLLKQ